MLGPKRGREESRPLQAGVPAPRESAHGNSMRISNKHWTSSAILFPARRQRPAARSCAEAAKTNAGAALRGSVTLARFCFTA